MSTADVIATIAAIIAFFSMIGAIASAIIAWRTMNLNKQLADNALIVNKQLANNALVVNEKIFLRENIITLHQIWDTVPPIDSQNPDPYAIAKAANVLDVTASLWNHEGLEKEVIYQSYWDLYRDLYDQLSTMIIVIPKLGRAPRSYLNDPVRTAYQDMLKYKPATQTGVHP